MQLLTDFAVADIPHEQGNSETVQFFYPSSVKGKTYSGLGIKYVDSEILYIPHLFKETKAARIFKALFSKTQSHVTLGAGQDMNSSLAKSIQLKG